jgi:tetratricopeptide (TPR) repeat protein
MPKRSNLFVLVFFPSLLLADTVYLKSGGKLSGRIATRSETEVQVNVGAGIVTVPMAKVDRIVEGSSALEEYARRAAALEPRDVDGWRELGRWAQSQSLNTQAHQAYQKVLEISPNDPEANQAMGKVQVGGRWVDEEESYRARGYVKFEGDWMTPAERQAILQHRSAAADAERATERAREAEARAREAEARARETEEAQEGIPLYWGWGTGPAAWPGTIVYPR